MSRFKTLLHDADPLRHDPPRPEAGLERVRQAVLGTPAIERSTKPARARFMIVGALAIAVISTVALGYLLWRNGTTTVLAAVRFEVRLAEEQPIPGLIVAQLAESDRVIYLHPETVVNNEDVAQSWVSQEGLGRFGVSIRLLPSGSERMRQATTAHVGRPVAILLDGSVVMAPVVQSPISDSAVISGNYTQAEAERIAKGIEIR